MSRALWTRKALWPEGIMWRVFLLLPYPIFGIGAWPLNRRRMALSIPFGLRQFGARHLKRSLWWRLKRVVPIFHGLSIPLFLLLSNLADCSIFKLRYWTLPSTGARSEYRGALFDEGGLRIINVRFFTIGTCFCAETIWNNVVSIKA